jgi:hypothetical protein
LSIALEHYGKQSKDRDLERWSATIKLRATRRLGEISAALPKTQGARHDQATSGNPRQKSKADVLADAGVSVQDANRAEHLSAIEEGVFEQYTAKKKAQGEPAYVQQAIKDVTEKKPLAMLMR